MSNCRIHDGTVTAINVKLHDIQSSTCDLQSLIDIHCRRRGVAEILSSNASDRVG